MTFGRYVSITEFLHNSTCTWHCFPCEWDLVLWNTCTSLTALHVCFSPDYFMYSHYNLSSKVSILQHCENGTTQSIWCYISSIEKLILVFVWKWKLDTYLKWIILTLLHSSWNGAALSTLYINESPSLIIHRSGNFNLLFWDKILCFSSQLLSANSILSQNH